VQGPADLATTAGAGPASKTHVRAALSLSLRLLARALLSLSAAAATTAFAVSIARAEAAPSKSIAVLVEGPNAAEIREDILSLMPDTLGVVSPEAFAKALQSAGQTKPIGTIILARKKRDKELGKLRKAAAAVKADAVIFGLSRTNRARKKEVYVVYVDQVPGDLSIDEGVPLGASRDARRKGLGKLLGPALAAAAPGGKATDEKPADGGDAAPASEGGGGDDDDDEAKSSEEPSSKEEPRSDRKPHEIGSALASVELGVEIAGRWFDYSDPVTANLRPYDVFGAPMGSISAEVYPLAGTSIPVLKGLGLTGGFARAFGLASSVEGGDPITTTYQRVNGGLRLRLPLSDDASAIVVGVSGGIRLLTFSFDAPADLADEVPDVSYTLLRGGLDVRVPVGPVALALGADYLGPLSTDDVYDRLEGASVAGVGFAAGVMVPITGGFEARLTAEYARFFSSFTPGKRDAYIAGGALDQFLGLRLAGAYVY
jgi:hypothetical protein